MNLERLIGNYHKANVASLGIAGLQQQLQEMTASGDDAPSLATARQAIEKHRDALDKVDGRVGQRWSWATFLYEKAQFSYVAILLLGGILIRNTLPKGLEILSCWGSISGSFQLEMLPPAR